MRTGSNPDLAGPPLGAVEGKWKEVKAARRRIGAKTQATRGYLIFLTRFSALMSVRPSTVGLGTCSAQTLPHHVHTKNSEFLHFPVGQTVTPFSWSRSLQYVEKGLSMRVVVVGQGNVGLPLVKAALDAGREVTSLDLDQAGVAELTAGHSAVDDIPRPEIQGALELGFRASSSTSAYEEAEGIAICVPTPLRDGFDPGLGAVHGAVAAISREVSAGAVVVSESTTDPGALATEFAPRFQREGFTIGKDLSPGFSLERIDPGNAVYGIRNTPRVISANNSESIRSTTDFYASFIEQVVPVSGPAEAELTKLLENPHRHMNIGLVKKIAVVFYELSNDVCEVINAAAKKLFGFQAFYPGPGAGGHCIHIDANDLNHRVRRVLGRPFQFVELAKSINSSMPGYVVSRAHDLLDTKQKSLNGSTVLLLGVSDKSGTLDTRISPATDIARLLVEKGARVSFSDPYIEHLNLNPSAKLTRADDLHRANSESDLTILLQILPGLPLDSLAEVAQGFCDTRGATVSPHAERLEKSTLS